MRRRGRLVLIVVLPDGRHFLVPAAWTDLADDVVARVVGSGRLGSVDDLFALRRVLDGLLRLEKGDEL